MRRAFDATVNDPEYLATTRKAGNLPNPMTGEALTEVVVKTNATPAAVIERYKAAVAIPQ